MEMIQVNIPEIFAYLPGEKSYGSSVFIFFYIFPLNSLNLVLISSGKFDGHRGIWTGCL